MVQRMMLYFFLAFLWLGLLGCSDSQSRGGTDVVETGDLDALIERGILRVVVPGTILGEPSLPRTGSPVGMQRELAEAFAETLGLELQLVPVFNLGEMLPLLAQGRADIIAANLTVTESRLERVDFSLPIDHVHEVVLVAADDDSIQRIEDLDGRRIMSDMATSFWETLMGLKETQPDMQIMVRPPHFDDEAVLDMVARGAVDATVRDSNIAQMYLAYRDDVRVAFPLGESRPIAWALRPDTPQLKAAVDRFLTMEKLTRPRETTYFGDLADLRERRVLRVLLPNSAASYFLWRGELVGFEYELFKQFADSQGMRLEVVVPPSQELAMQWLQEGRADVAGGFLELHESDPWESLAFTRFWHLAQPYLVTRGERGEISAWDELRGATVAAAADSLLWVELSALAAQNNFDLYPLPQRTGDAEVIVDRLVAREFDYVVLEEHLLSVELAQRDDIRKQLPVGEPIPHAWAVRAQSPELHAALNQFIQEEYRGTIYNILYRRYFRDVGRIRQQQEERIRGMGQLSPYDDVIRRYAEEYGFDWRLIVALIYQESRFDPEAKSPMGAQGLMQLMPRTAQQMGVQRVTDPEDNIRAGVRYLDWVQQRFPEDLPVADRVWFTLAAYNAGLGHVLDARRLAEQKGWDPNRWFDHVERAMLLLSQRHYYSQARHGYVRGSETVAYLTNISQRFKAYVQLTEEPLVSVLSTEYK